MFTLFVLILRSLQYDACRSDSEEGSVLDHPLFPVSEDLVIDEGAGIAGTVPEDIFKVAPLVTADVEGAVVDVDARVVGLDGSVCLAALHVSANHVVTHLQRDDLLVVEHVLNDNYRAHTIGIGVLVGIVLLLRRLQL